MFYKTYKNTWKLKNYEKNALKWQELKYLLKLQ